MVGPHSGIELVFVGPGRGGIEYGLAVVGHPGGKFGEG